jgi:hypothetical protein
MIWRYIQYAMPIVYVVGMAVWAAADVGYESHLSFRVFLILGVAAVTGFFAGRASAGKSEVPK